MTLIAHLQKHGDSLRAMDIAFADTLRRLDPDTNGLVLAGAALASLAVSAGHAAFDPAQPQWLVGDVEGLPDAEPWIAALRSSPWVSEPQSQDLATASKPLVLENGLLYLRRYREYERRLAAGLQRIATRAPSAVDVVALAPLFAMLFPDAPVVREAHHERMAEDDGGQARAAALALLRSLLLVVGGPGTGKTTTIARLLLLLVAAAHRAGDAPPRIALAAPTGRAAERMAESLRLATMRLRLLPGMEDHLCDALPTEARTLHRVLGTIPGSPRFRHHADHPLPFDVVVVDEASMVDLPLMCKLVEAVAGGARLVLLGDRDQLPSVEAGDVLAAITDAAGPDDALPADAAQALVPLLGTLAGDAIAPPGRSLPLLAGHRVRLRRSYRQADTLDLAPLAMAMRDGDAETVLALLRSRTLDGVHFHEDLLDPLTGATHEPLLAQWRALLRSANADDPATALAQAGRVRLLTALREGPQGANALNARIEEMLAGAQRELYFHGRVLLVTENSYRHGLFNGDIGVCLRTPDSAVAVAFFGGSEGIRGFHPSSLPAHTGAFAMTVHKAQGSEFDAVWLQLPKNDARPLSRELLYTAITRARASLDVCASETVLRAALARHAARVSGLSRRLVTP